MAWFAQLVEPVLEGLPRGVVHRNLNVLAALGADGRYHVSGVLDFSDALHTVRVSELAVAVAVAYAMLRAPDPLGAATDVVAGFDAVRPLSDTELSVVFSLAAARLCINATSWTAGCAAAPDGYGASRVHHTWLVVGDWLDVADPRPHATAPRNRPEPTSGTGRTATVALGSGPAVLSGAARRPTRRHRPEPARRPPGRPAGPDRDSSPGRCAQS